MSGSDHEEIPESDIEPNAPLQDTIQRPRSNENGPFVHTLQPYNASVMAAWFPQPPQGYVFQNTSAVDPEKARQTDELCLRLNKRSTKARTKERFEAKGSIVRPPNGTNVKEEQESCLTCINQGCKCRGTDVEDGKCYNCRGGDWATLANGQQKPTRAVRICRWKQPDKEIWTYEDHASYYDPDHRIPGNTKKGRFEREMTKNDLWPTILDIPPQSHESQILRWITANMVTAGGLNDDSARNLDGMIEQTMRSLTYVSRASTIADPRVRRQVAAAVNEIYLRLLLWHERGRGIDTREIRELLPDTHPNKRG